jgi:hypothetical protein
VYSIKWQVQGAALYVNVVFCLVKLWELWGNAHDVLVAGETHKGCRVTCSWYLAMCSNAASLNSDQLCQGGCA